MKKSLFCFFFCQVQAHLDFVHSSGPLNSGNRQDFLLMARCGFVIMNSTSVTNTFKLS